MSSSLSWILLQSWKINVSIENQCSSVSQSFAKLNLNRLKLRQSLSTTHTLISNSSINHCSFTDSSISSLTNSLLSISLLKLPPTLLLNHSNHLHHLNCLHCLNFLCHLNCMHHPNCLHCLHHALNLCWFTSREQVSQVILHQILLSKRISPKISQKSSCNLQHSNNQMMLMSITVSTNWHPRRICSSFKISSPCWIPAEIEFRSYAQIWRSITWKSQFMFKILSSSII